MRMGRVIDAPYISRQIMWSQNTFGPGQRNEGIIDHIKKELEEIENDPDGDEWKDIIILALDGFWRAGYSPQQIIDRVIEKQIENESRTWPDWREAEPGKAIEHVR